MAKLEKRGSKSGKGSKVAEFALLRPGSTEAAQSGGVASVESPASSTGSSLFKYQSDREIEIEDDGKVGRPSVKFAKDVTEHFSSEAEKFESHTNYFTFSFSDTEMEHRFNSFVNHYYGSEIRATIFFILCAYVAVILVNLPEMAKYDVEPFLAVGGGLMVIVLIFILVTIDFNDIEKPNLLQKQMRYIRNHYSSVGYGFAATTLIILFIFQHTIMGVLSTDRFIIYYLMTLVLMTSLGFLRNIYFLWFAWPCFIIWETCVWLRYYEILSWNGVSSDVVEIVTNAVDFNIELQGRVDMIEIVQGSLVLVISNLLVTFLLRKQERQRRLQWIQLWAEYNVWKKLQAARSLSQQESFEVGPRLTHLEKSQSKHHHNLSAIDETLNVEQLRSPITINEIQNAKKNIIRRTQMYKQSKLLDAPFSDPLLPQSAPGDSNHQKSSSSGKLYDNRQHRGTLQKRGIGNMTVESTQLDDYQNENYHFTSQSTFDQSTDRLYSMLFESLNPLNPLIANAEHCRKLREERNRVINGHATRLLAHESNATDVGAPSIVGGHVATLAPLAIAPISPILENAVASTEVTSGIDANNVASPSTMSDKQFAQKSNLNATRQRKSLSPSDRRILNQVFIGPNRQHRSMLSNQEFGGAKRGTFNILHFFAEGFAGHMQGHGANFIGKDNTRELHNRRARITNVIDGTNLLGSPSLEHQLSDEAATALAATAASAGDMRTSMAIQARMSKSKTASVESASAAAASVIVDQSTMIKTSETEHEKMDATGLYALHQLPPWYSAYPYILHAYRLNQDVTQTLKSIFQLHNETTNIWTEFIPAMILCGYSMYYAINDDDTWRSQPTLTKVFLAIVIPFYWIRPILSGFAHAMHGMSEEASRKWWNVDFVSIVLIAGLGSALWIHFIFFCEPALQYMFLFCLGAFSVTAIVVSTSTNEDSLRETVLALYIFFTEYFVFGYFLVLLATGNTEIPATFALLWGLALVSSIVAVILRALNFPESWLVQRSLRKRLGRDKYLKLQNKVRERMETGTLIEDDIIENEKREENDESQWMTDESALQMIDEALIALSNRKRWYYYIGNSHNWWHIFLNGMELMCLVACVYFLKWRAQNQC